MQVISGLLLMLLGFAMMANVATEFVAPAFYKGLEGPKFTVVKKLADNIELRSYEPSSWVSIKREGMEIDQAMSGSFMKLFNYISGANSANAKIEMTAPVLTKIEPGQGPACNSAFTMSFYQPWKYQGGAAAPKPTDSSASLTSLPAMNVYVQSFGGFANAAEYKKQATQLMTKLDELDEPYNTQFWFTAGYDSPYTLTNRRNEVWVMAGKPTVQSAAKAAAAPKPAAAKPTSPAVAKDVRPAAGH
eukprot:gene4207-4456_t